MNAPLLPITRFALGSAWVASAGLAFALLTSQCHVIQPGVSAAPSTVTDQSSCQAACDNIKSLGCAEANPIDMGTKCNADTDCMGPDGKHDTYQTCSAAGGCIVTCANFCVSTENTGVWLSPTCVVSVTSCSAIDQCSLSQTGTTCTGSSCKVSPH